jgi:ketosteroid isomerase-like protein
MRTVFSIAIAMTLTTLISAAADAASSRDEAAIMGIERGMAAAQSVNTLLASWDADAVWFDINPGAVVGIAAIRKDAAAQLAGVKNFQTNILRIKIEAGSTVAFAYSVVHFTGDSVNGGAPMDLTLRQTDGFVKKKRKWMLVHQHISLPVDLQTGKPVFNAQ